MLIVLLQPPLIFLSAVILPSSATSNSYRPSVSSSPTSIFTKSSSAVQRPTVSSTSEPPTPLGPTECRPNTCKNGGRCVEPGYFCRCPKYYVWNGCVVYVGKCVLFIWYFVFQFVVTKYSVLVMVWKSLNRLFLPLHTIKLNNKLNCFVLTLKAIF